MNNYLKYGTIGGTIAGGAFGIIGQTQAQKFDPQADSGPSAYLANIITHAPIGALAGAGAGFGVQEIAKAISKV